MSPSLDIARASEWLFDIPGASRDQPLELSESRAILFLGVYRVNSIGSSATTAEHIPLDVEKSTQHHLMIWPIPECPVEPGNPRAHLRPE